MSRRVQILAAIVCSAVLLYHGEFRGARADAPSTPASPTALTVSTPDGKIVSPGSWVASTKLDLHLRATVSGGPLTPQVEVVPSTSAFTGKPTSSGAPVSSTDTATVSVSNLVDGQSYRWQARLVDSSGNASAWTIFNPSPAATVGFSIDVTPPDRPTIVSSTNPSQSAWYNSRTVDFRWKSTDSGSGIKGFTFAMEQRAHVIPPGALTSQTHLSLKKLADGVWILALRAEDRAGNWSPTATYRVQLDRRAPQISWVGPQRFSYNPYRGSTTLKISVSKDSDVQVQLYRVGSSKAVRSYTLRNVKPGATSIIWNGKDAHNRMVPKGYYFVTARAVDRANNVTRGNFGGIDVNPQSPMRAATGQLLFPQSGKEIIVSLSRETLYAYDGTHLVLQTYVTTGNPNLPTPVGSYTILAKYHPYEFISPWPPGSQYYYPPSESNYAMLFRDGGYFLHDAPWRSAFGPGTNGAGQPGSNYGGTHGCVNIPPGPTLYLWNWAPVGTTVLVVN